MTEKKKLISDEDKKKAALLLLGIGGGVAGSRAFNKYVPNSLGFPAVSSSVIVSAGVMPGVANPVVTGMAAGRVIDYLVDKLSGNKKPKSDIKDRLDKLKRGKISLGEDKKPYRKWDIHIYNIPPWLPVSWQYGIAVDKIRGLINNPSYNRVTKKWVPAGYMHPAVIYFAKSIVRDYAGDGREIIGICNGVTDWTHTHCPWTGELFGESDMFMHPALVLETMDENGQCIPIDCDCQTAINCSLLKSLGIQPYLVLIGQDPDEIGFNHILVAVKVPKKFRSECKHPPWYFIDSTTKPGHLEHDYIPQFKRIMVKKV